MTAPRLTASSLWRAEACPASVVLPSGDEQHGDAREGNRKHAELESLAPPGSIPEAAFAYNVLSGEARFIGSGRDRDYGPCSEGEIPGTTDLLTIQDDHLLIDDYKTGHGYAEQLAGVADKPKDNLQLQHNSLAAAIVHKKPRVIAQVIYTKTGEVKDAEFDEFDFVAIRNRLRTIWELTKDKHLLVQEGAHCWRCPAKKACPLKKRRRS